MDTSKASDYPNSITAFGTRTNSYDGEVSLSVSGYAGSIEYTATYTPDTAGVQNIYWGVFPVKSKSVTTQTAALACTVSFAWKDSTGYSRTILTLSHESLAGNNDNGPLYMWEAVNIRTYY